ncbi:MAG: alpha/beta fold hydrolase [Gemmatimonadaceae bacterium]
MHIERYGQGGHSVVLLHGFATCSFLWRAVAPILAENGYCAYAVDLLGYGESDRPFGADYSVAAQATYLEIALATLRAGRSTVAGIDIGGGVAQRLAVERPERVGWLALINSVGFDQWPTYDTKMVQRGTARFALRVSRGMLGVAPLLTPVLEGSVGDSAHMPTRLVARYLAPYVGSEGVRHLLALAAALDEHDLETLPLEEIACPTLVVRGEEDRWLNDDVAERLHLSIPDSRIVRLPGVGRLVPEDAPEMLAALLMELTRVENHRRGTAGD